MRINLFRAKLNTMNPQDLSKATTTSSSSLNDEEKALAADHEEDSLLPVSKRDRFLSTYLRQNFAFPDSIMYYIAMNPATPKVCQSLIKSCKYFFIMNPIIVISDAAWDGEEWRGDVYGRQSIIDFTKFCTKIWIDGRFDIFDYIYGIQSIVSTIIPIPKLYRCDAKKLTIENKIIYFNDYAFLSSSAERIHLDNVTVKDENGDVPALEKLVETAAQVKWFNFLSNNTLTNVTSKSAKKLFENPDFSRLENFELDYIPEAFDIEAFYKYMKNNKSTRFWLMFDATISDAYKARLNAIIDEILGTETLDYKPPVFYFDGIEREKYHKLQSLYGRC